jgi:hypothetical protein
VPSIFSGAYKLFINKSQNREQMADKDTQENLHSLVGTAPPVLRSNTDDMEVQTITEGMSINKDLSEKQAEKSGFQIMGMISHNKELFLFETAVPMEGSPVQWMLKVEAAMQDTIAKQINYAISASVSELWVSTWIDSILLLET